MRIYFDYPLATEENMSAVQAAINAGKESDELEEMFDEEVLWDCVAVLSGNKDTPWALLDHMDGHEQYSTEVWQHEIIYDYIGQCEFLRSLSDRDELAIKIREFGHQDRVLLIEWFGQDGGWDYYLVNANGEMLDEGGVYCREDEDADNSDIPLDEAVRAILRGYQIPMNCTMSLLPNYRELKDKALDYSGETDE